MGSVIKIDEQFNLYRGGKDIASFIQNICTECGWEGLKHYAHNSNCIEERQRHIKKCGTYPGAIEEGFEYIGIDEDKDSVDIGNKRILSAEPQLF